MAGCVPCVVIPLLLFIFHRFIQPILLKFWNPWAKTDALKENGEKSSDTKETSCPISSGASELQCPMTKQKTS